MGVSVNVCVGWDVGSDAVGGMVAVGWVAVLTAVAVTEGVGALVGTDVGLGGVGVSARAATGALVGGGVGGITVGGDACCGAFCVCGDAAGVLPPQAAMNDKARASTIPAVAALKLMPVPADVRMRLIALPTPVDSIGGCYFS